MRALWSIWCSVWLIGACTALPISTTVVGDRNAALIGVIAVISISAILGACVCCRRRKRGFEEFENESGSTDPARSEFPIFRALSSPQNTNYRRSSTEPSGNIVAANHNNIHDNYQDGFDNNNGPISPADMENIENNNAVDYIPNRNEIGVVVEPVFSLNRNILAAPPEPPTTSYITLNIEPPEFSESNDDGAENIPALFHSFPINNNLNQYNPFHPVNIDEIHINIDDSMVQQQLQHQVEQEQLQRKCEKYDLSLNPFTIANNSVGELSAENVSEYKNDEEIDSICESEKCDSEKSSIDVNSVEEALRALDFAISGEDSLQPDNNDNDSSDESTKDSSNSSNFQNVLRQFLINNSDTNLLECHRSNECPIESTAYDEVILENVKTEAKLLVDSIIDECQLIISKKLENTASSIDDSSNNQSFLINAKHSLSDASLVYPDIENNEMIDAEKDHSLFFLNEENALNQTIINLGNTESCLLDCHKDSMQSGNSCSSYAKLGTKDSDDSLENSDGMIEESFLKNISMTTSTPCMQNKFMAIDDSCKRIEQKILFNTDDITVAIVNDGIALINNETFESPKPLSQICQEKFCDKYNILPEFESTNVENATFSLLRTDITFVESKNDDSIISPIISKPANETFNKNETFSLNTYEEVEVTSLDCPIIKFDREEMLSADLSTATPVNTPIELNYSLDSWDKFISNTMPQSSLDTNQPCTSAQAACSGWFLHPQQMCNNDTYEVNEEDEENMSQTFDALRKQLAEALPHAQGIIGPPDFPDDMDDDDEDFDQKSPTSDENIAAEMVINYKRPLSPIMEESEDETCKTFILNETKLLDSTSTGCIETCEAIMGVTKTLMASNDTLFNFEDTLGERDDLFSPRANSQNEFLTAVSRNDTKTSESTATTPDVEVIVKSFVPMEFNANDVMVVNELLSPDQPKTFSDETITVEHVSSDLSGTVDATLTTNTFDEKTCISVHIKEDERISEISEPDWDSTSCNVYDLNSFADIPSLEVQAIDSSVNQELQSPPNINHIESGTLLNLNEDTSKQSEDIPDKRKDEMDESATHTCNPLKDTIKNIHEHDHFDGSMMHEKEFTQSFLNNEITYSSSQLYNISVNVDNTKENNDPNIKPNDSSDFIESTKLENNLEAVICENNILYDTDLSSRFNHTEIHLSEKSSDLHKHHLPIITSCIVNEIDLIDGQNCLIVSDDRISQLSGEEDPWAHPIADIRFNGPTNEIISTSFASTEWDSDVDDSNSSEEFMYVKGTPTQVPSPDIYKHQLENKNGRQHSATIIPEEDIDSVWNTHQDQVPVSSKGENKSDTENSDDSNSDIEGEWVPSSWDSMAQPARSALKSPDKSSSVTKKRRSVAFKKQNYHSVYEYPKETVSLSPSYSEPHIWERDLPNLRVDTDDISTDLSSLDGFTISSSARPFHGSQFNAQCHTWPTDTDFSWSQVQNEEHNEKYPTYSEIQIKWPKNIENLFYKDESKDKLDGEITRPDSGVGESAELLSESLSLGDLCHQKSSLTLPLKAVPVEATETNSSENCLSDDAFKDQKENNIISTTPSCTGSMDSLSSSSGSERQVSFTTFGKNNTMFDDNHLNEQDLKPSLVLIENENILDIECSTIKTKHDRSTKQNDSTDEDSGIESIVRKENV